MRVKCLENSKWDQEESDSQYHQNHATTSTITRDLSITSEDHSNGWSGSTCTGGSNEGIKVNLGGVWDRDWGG